MSDDVRPAVGFIGLGNMGRPMSARLIEAGHRLLGFDLSESARAAFAEAGGEPVQTAGEAAKAAVVILILPSSEIVASVLHDEAVRAALAPGAIVIDMSSSEPQVTRELAAELAEAGVIMIDAPVSGGVAGAVAGALTIMVGGAQEHVERVTPILSLLGRVVHAGGIGAGHAIKALNNLLSATHLWATSEAMEAGKRFGLDPQVMLDVFNGSSGRSGSTENKWPNFILPGTFDSGFGLRLMLKDMRIATKLSEQMRARSALGENAVELWATAAEELPPTADHTEVAAWIAEHAERDV